jgi:hypothetical protein
MIDALKSQPFSLITSYLDLNTAVTFALPDFSRVTAATVHTPPLPTKQISNSRGTIPAVIYSSTLEKVLDCVIEMEARRKVAEMKMVNQNVNSLKVTTWQTAKQLLHCPTSYDKDTAFVSKFSKGLYSTSYGFNVAGKELQ